MCEAESCDNQTKGKSKFCDNCKINLQEQNISKGKNCVWCKKLFNKNDFICDITKKDGRIYCSWRPHCNICKDKPRPICKYANCTKNVSPGDRDLGWCKEHKMALKPCSKCGKSGDKMRKGLCNACNQQENKKSDIVCHKCGRVFDGQGRQCNDCKKEKEKTSNFTEIRKNRTAEEALSLHQNTCCVDCQKPFNKDLSVEELKKDWTFRGGDSGMWRNMCRECHNKPKYSTKHYQKHNNEPQFMERQKERSAKRRLEHPEEGEEYNRRRVEDLKDHWRVLRSYFIGAGVDETDNVTLDTFYEMFQKPCHYCGINRLDHRYFNGIDRVLPGLPYSNINNCVPCCRDCNRMKSNRHAHQFIHSVRNIIQYTENNYPKEFFESRKKGWFGYGKTTQSPAIKNMELTEQEYDLLINASCYLCGKSKSNGIDRIDSTGHYTRDNSMPCCSNCNYLKLDMPLDGFLGQCFRINEFTSQWQLQEFANFPIFNNYRGYKAKWMN